MKQITYSEYLQLIGLKTLADRHNKELDEILKSAQNITGEVNHNNEPELSGHTSDWIYGMRSTDEVLKLLGITVKNPKSK